MDIREITMHPAVNQAQARPEAATGGLRHLLTLRHRMTNGAMAKANRAEDVEIHGFSSAAVPAEPDAGMYCRLAIEAGLPADLADLCRKFLAS